MKKKKTMFVVPAPIRSHVLPSFYLSAKLQEAYDIFYLSSDARLKELIEAQGYGFIQLQSRGIGFYAEHYHVENKYKKASSWIKLMVAAFLYISNKIYRVRKRELKLLMNRYNPSLVLIDSFNSTDFVFFYPYHRSLQIFFYSPMLTSDVSLQQHGEERMDRKGLLPEIGRRIKPLQKIKWPEVIDCWQVKRCSWLAGVPPRHAVETDNRFTTYRFKNTTELVLGPRELELPPFPSHSEAYYLGLCTQVRRKETGTDPLFDSNWLEESRRSGKKLVYCSFGTFYRSAEHHRAIIGFINRLVAATMDRNDIELVVALNNKTAAIINATLPAFPHIHIFGVLPQLDVLAKAAVFITHAGLGSVKEAIYFKVPMLAYPVDYRWDQPANARRIEYHKLGLAGNLRNDSVETIEASLNEILKNTVYKERLNSFSNTISEELPDFMLRSCSA